MAKPSATTFVVGYSVVLLILFVTFSILMSKVNPDRIFFEDEGSTDPSVSPGPDSDTTEGDEVPITPKTGRLLNYARRSSDNVNCKSLLNLTTDNYTNYLKDNNTDDVPTKEYLGKERRSLKDPSSVLKQLGIVVLEVVDEDGQPRIEIMFHPKRSLMKRTKKNSGTNNIRKSFSAYGEAKIHKGLVTELTDNSVIKIMPDNTIVLENSNTLVSEENAQLNSNADVPSTVVEPALLPTETTDVINTIAAVIDETSKKVTSFKVGVTLETTDEKQFEDTETIETTTDETFERTTNIDDMFEAGDIKSSKISNLSKTMDLNDLESNSSITAIYNYDLDTINMSENYNNTETTDADNFDVNDTIATGFITELDSRSTNQIIDKQTFEETYTTEIYGMNFEVINSNNTTAEVINYEVSDTTKVNVTNVDDRNATNYHIINTIEPLADADILNKNGTITIVSDSFKTTEESVILEGKAPLKILDGETFNTDSRLNTPNSLAKVEYILKTAKKGMEATVETIFNAETSEVTNSSLQNKETTTNAVVSTLDMKNPLKLLPLIDNATNAVGNTVDNPSTNWHVTAKSVPTNFEGYFATETIFNDE